MPRQHIRRLAPRRPRTPASPFNASTPDDDPVNHGPIIALVGQGASPSNAASFRGFVALDIRNFQYASPPSNVFYNGVTRGTNANTLKAMEAGWVATGYPGPDFPPVTVPPDPNDQVGIIDGNSSGIVVDAINDRYDPGAEILAAVYSGHGLEHPGLQLRGPEHGDDQHEPEPQRLDHDERDEERLVHGRRVDERLPELGRADPPVGHDADARCRSARAR